MHLESFKNKLKEMMLAKNAPAYFQRALAVAILMLFVAMGVFADNLEYASESEKRRVDISLTIFPRIVAVDNGFRSKLGPENKAQLIFLYVDEKDRATSLAEALKLKNKNIGGMGVSAKAVSLNDILSVNKEFNSTAIFLSERLGDDDLKKIIKFSVERNRILFSPYAGDVERGAMVGISVTNRVKPFFNLATLKKSKIVINALLMKMSRRYE